jgi:hypothetical protein
MLAETGHLLHWPRPASRGHAVEQCTSVTTGSRDELADTVPPHAINGTLAAYTTEGFKLLSRQATRAPTTPLRALVGEVEEASGAAAAAHGMKSLFDAIPGIVFYIPVVLIR